MQLCEFHFLFLQERISFMVRDNFISASIQVAVYQELIRKIWSLEGCFLLNHFEVKQ